MFSGVSLEEKKSDPCLWGHVRVDVHGESSSLEYIQSKISQIRKTVKVASSNLVSDAVRYFYLTRIQELLQNCNRNNRKAIEIETLSSASHESQDQQ